MQHDDVEREVDNFLSATTTSKIVCHVVKLGKTLIRIPLKSKIEGKNRTSDTFEKKSKRESAFLIFYFCDEKNDSGKRKRNQIGFICNQPVRK